MMAWRETLLSSRACSSVAPIGSARRGAAAASALVVEHDTTCAAVIGDWLRGAGWSVQHADDGVDALENLTERHFELVVVELQVPGVNGWELLRYMRGKWELGLPLATELTRVVAMSDRHEAEVARFACRLGADAFLAKPFTEETLVKVIRKNHPARSTAVRPSAGVEQRL